MNTLNYTYAWSFKYYILYHVLFTCYTLAGTPLFKYHLIFFGHLRNFH